MSKEKELNEEKQNLLNEREDATISEVRRNEIDERLIEIDEELKSLAGDESATESEE